jgi:short-subunit dehydrogenase
MQARVDSKRFGPWVLATGASSDIGREFARETNSLQGRVIPSFG